MKAIDYYPDVHMPLMAAGTLQPDYAMIEISNSGNSKTLVKLRKIGRTNGVKVISTTSPGFIIDQVTFISLNIIKNIFIISCL